MKIMAILTVYSALNILIIIMMAQSSAASLDKDDTWQNLSISCNDFTKDFYKELTLTNKGNIVNSPLSIHMILSHLSHGAESITLDEFTKGLYHNDKDSINEGYKSLIIKLNELTNVKLYIANTMYIQQEFKLLTEFLTVGEKIYQSEISKVNFEHNVDAAKQINTWVKEKTNDKITDLVSSDDFDKDTRLVLINAIYFNGSWLHPFNAKDTQNRVFYVTKHQTKLVPTMFKKSQYTYGNLPKLNAKFIEIPYMNTDIIMTIILPNEMDDFSTLQNNFSWEALATASRTNKDVELYLPKFKIEFKVDLKDTLNKLGLSTMFAPNANFNRISSTPLTVSKVIHKAVIEVSEQGTEAAAATVVHMRLRRMIDLEEPETFVVDRPFMFIIQHKPSNIPLFIGRVQDIAITPQKDEL